MTSSSTDFTHVNRFLRNEPTTKTKGFPGFKDIPFPVEELKKFGDEELYRLFRLYGFYITEKFYTLVSTITLPTRCKLEDYLSGKRKPLLDTRISQSEVECDKMILWGENMYRINQEMRRRFLHEKYPSES